MLPTGRIRFLCALFGLGAFSLLPAAPGVRAAVHGDALHCEPFRDLASGPNPLYVASADFNGDGRPDLAVTNSDYASGGYGGSVSIFLATGPRAFAAPVRYAVGRNPHMVTTGDFNGDGIVDLVVANKYSSSVSVLLGNGIGGVPDGTFAPAVSYPTGGFPFQLVVRDFNGDGVQDLAVSLNNVAAVALLPGLGANRVGDGTFGAATLVPLASVSSGLEHGDFNGDGIEDLVATEDLVGRVAVLPGTGAPVLGPGSFGPPLETNAGSVPFELAAGDFNGDGRLDLAVANNSDDGTAILLGNGNGMFHGAGFVPSGNTAAVAVDDVNGDGIPDLVVGTVTGANGGDARIYPGQGTGGIGNGTFGAAGEFAAGGDAYQVLPGDFDGDGRRDLVVSQYENTAIALLWGSQPGSTAVDPPRAALAIAGRNPARGGRIAVDLALPAAVPARLEVVDVAGRIVVGYDVGSLGAGTHTFDITRGSLPGAGVYFLRLSQDGCCVLRRIVVLD